MTDLEDPPYGYCRCGCGEKTNIAPLTSTAKGWTKGEPMRWRLGHQTRKSKRWEERDGGYHTPCHVWLLAKNRGYGTSWDPSLCVMRGAHVLAWEAANGPVPDGLELDHLCRVPACCNPDHLEPVTRAENVRRSEAGAYLKRRTHCPKGHPYAGDNLLIRKGGHRGCRACLRVQKAAWAARHAMAQVEAVADPAQDTLTGF